MIVALQNDFHNTSANVRTGLASRETVRRVRRTLCPSWRECTCGDSMGCRGPQRTTDGDYIVIQPRQDGGAWIDLAPAPKM